MPQRDGDRGLVQKDGGLAHLGVECEGRRCKAFKVGDFILRMEG